jgi:transposase
MKILVSLAKAGHIDMFFADESGFSLTPYVPYGWQPTGEQLGIATTRKNVANVFALLSPFTGSLVSFLATKQEKINSSFIIEQINRFAKGITKETVIVLDNAPWHKSAQFKSHIEQWEKKGLFIFYLPPYSPHLNLMETLWRKIKHEWLRPKDYNSKTSLLKRIKEIFKSFGQQFSIKFALSIFN